MEYLSYRMSKGEKNGGYLIKSQEQVREAAENI